MSNIVPEKIRTLDVYINGNTEPGIAEGSFPSLEYMTSEVKGAGLAGTVDSITVGHFGSITCSLTWRYTPKNYFELLEPRIHTLDLYAALQALDAGRGTFTTKQLHMFMRAQTKKGDFGSLTVGDSMGAETEHEIITLKVEYDGKETFMLDKYNFICRVNGTDYLADTRKALGRV